MDYITTKTYCIKSRHDDHYQENIRELASYMIVYYINHRLALPTCFLDVGTNRIKKNILLDVNRQIVMFKT